MQSFSWRVDLPQMTSMDTLIDRASDLQDLVSIGTGRTETVEFMQFWRREIFRESSGKKIALPVELFVRWNTQPSKQARPLRATDLYFSFGDIGELDAVAKWADAAERHRGPLGRVMATTYAHGMFVSDRLMNCCAALEAFDRKISGAANSRFKTRLTRCVDIAGKPFLEMIGDVARWTETIRNERDDVAHHFGRRMRSSTVETHYLWKSLYWLFVMCMLRQAAVPDAVFGKIRGHQETIHLIPRIKAAVK
jgi:hypothetical protein